MATTTKTERSIRFKNVQAIEDLVIPLPEEGGVTVLRGFSGVGKSTALEAVGLLTSGQGSVSKRDGTLKGEIEGLGVSISLQKSTRRKGEAEVVSIDGKLSISDLVDPKIKDPVAADARRIKALVSLAADDPGPDLFYDLAESPEEFGAIVGDDLLDCSDVLSRAQRVKRCFEKAARQAESEHDHVSGQLEHLVAELAPLEGAEIPDPDAIQTKLDGLIKQSGVLDGKRKAAEKARADADLGRKKLEAIAAKPSNVEQLKSIAQQKSDALLRLQATKEEGIREVERLERELSNARHMLEKCNAAMDHANAEYTAAAEAVKAAEEREALLSQLRDQIAAAEAVECPSDEEAEALQRELSETREQLQRALSVRAILAKRPEMDRLAQAKRASAEKAARYRAAAAKAEEKLTSLVGQPGCPLRVEEGRLVVSHKRGTVPFAELSDGERCRIALQLVLPRVGAHGLVRLDQQLWEGLPPSVQKEVADEARRLRINVVTAQCSDDPHIKAEVL